MATAYKRLATGVAGNVIRSGREGNRSLDANANPSMGVPPEAWFQNERELKRERRKQSNRESARRSRLRKQAESEDLAHKVEALIAENVALKSEIGQFTEKSEKLRQENAALMEKMKNAKQLGGHKQITLKSIDDEIAPTDNTENLLSKVDNTPGSVDRNTEGVGETYEKNSNSNTKLHQLLDTSPRADAVAAG
jgi:plant G-box-binding factor